MCRRKGIEVVKASPARAGLTAGTIGLLALQSATAHGNGGPDKEYVEKLHKARAEYAEQLKTYWGFDVIARPKLRQGSQTIGRSDDNDIVIGICPERLGSIKVEDATIHLTLDPAAATASFHGSDKRAGELQKGYEEQYRVQCADGFLFANDEGVLRIVKPGAGPDPVPRFHEVDARWRIEGKYIPVTQPQKKTYLTSKGEEESGFVYGRLQFKLGGTTYDLEPNPVPTEYADMGMTMLPFWDRTNGKSTYGGGRFLNVDIPSGKSVEQKVVIDFNEAYNPMCVFDDHISCALPPPENRLRTAVLAGEMMPEDDGAPLDFGGPRPSQPLP